MLSDLVTKIEGDLKGADFAIEAISNDTVEMWALTYGARSWLVDAIVRSARAEGVNIAGTINPDTFKNQPVTLPQDEALKMAPFINREGLKVFVVDFPDDEPFIVRRAA